MSPAVTIAAIFGSVFLLVGIAAFMWWLGRRDLRNSAAVQGAQNDADIRKGKEQVAAEVAKLDAEATLRNLPRGDAN